MTETDLTQKVQRLHGEGALTEDELKQIKAAFQAKKRLPLLLAAGIVLSILLLTL
jgi:hypothetical protein